MDGDLLLGRARELWVEAAGAAVAFPAPGEVDVVVSPGSQLCPPGWAGVVLLGGAGIATAPDAREAELLAGAVRKSAPAGEPVAADRLLEALAVVDVLGPASLLYLDRAAFLPHEGAAVVEEVACDGAEMAVLLDRVGAADADESGLSDVTSPVFVVRAGAGVVAAAGYQVWPRSVAQHGVLVAPGSRGRGLARTVASAAVAHALDAGLLPQWRARPEPSKRVALALGFREAGFQVSIRLGEGKPAAGIP
ncbi:GNAT family N-acetyltransferase [Embleya scabrispora]|uniref:GNAT family N-acetyltransferase n=1 Tax=Embleya scabrispora TaxID=159449 RepID=UPI000375C226|nr:GNAT family N-acetyltransferase [Embleya scabrispora]MYS83889.1 GNAT family N-acetyltransferase [Streptomyces sp. SID5474]